MTNGELIKKLQKYSLELPVRIADWNENYRAPADVGKVVLLETSDYYRLDERHDNQPNIVLDVI